MKIIEYKIVADKTHNGLSEVVNEYISEGWQPFNGPFEGYSARFQAMVKYEEPNQE